jgi:predicted PhzF superfamily epimerase YddE/YHI9
MHSVRKADTSRENLQLAIGDMVILTQPAPPESGFDVYSRVFGPDEEIPEDPVVSSLVLFVSSE